MFCAESRRLGLQRRAAALRCFAGVLALLPASARGVSAQTPAEHVNTLRGSDSSPDYSRGSTFPAVAAPFGFNLWTPITQPDAANGLYRYEDQAIQGFAASHEPSSALGDYASFQVMPSVGKIAWRAGERAATFRHTREVAKGHYYRVDLDSGIRVEVTPTLHAAAFRITFPGRGPRNLLFDAQDNAKGGMSADVAQRSVSGAVSLRGPKLYFYAKVDAPVQSAFSPPDGGPNVAISFGQGGPRTLTLRVGTSYLSVEQARTHVEQELAELSFDAIQEQARARWDSLLGRITIEGATDSQKTTFYSSLYRALLYPSTMTELVNGSDQHFSPYSHDVRPGVLYVNHSFAHAYRALWPLYFLLIPAHAGTMLDGFVNAYREGGWLPRASAPGYRDGQIGAHASVVFADAYGKGIRNFDAHTAYAAMLKDALVMPTHANLGRAGMARGVFRNFIPHEDTAGSAVWHLENSIDDFGISRLAQALGDHPHAQYLRLRSFSYGTLFSPTVGFFRGRLADGSFRTPDDVFRPDAWGHEFAQGCAYHYIAAANHDPGGMASLYGGAKAFAAKLDAMISAPAAFDTGSFERVIHAMTEARDGGMGQYAHVNEATHHILYMFDYLGQPWLTQKYVRKVLSKSSPFYGAGEAGGGYLGADDMGRLSAWYVFSALGFYPARVGQDSYAIGSPLFKRSRIALESGKAFEVVARDNSEENIYIQRASLNGQPLEAPYLTHAAIVNGGVLELFMGAAPSTWGNAAIAPPELAGSEAFGTGVLTDCAKSGTASASLENADAGEGASSAFDDDSRTKWLARESAAWLRYEAPSACPVRFYTLTSADDEPARDPKEWTLEGSSDGASWVVLDQRHNENFAYRHQTRVFELPQTAAFASYRLRVTANHGDGNVQLAELELLQVRGQDAPNPAASSPPAPREDSLFCRLVKHWGCSVAAPGSAGRTSWSLWVLAALALRRKRH